MPSASAPVHLTWPYTIDCHTETEAVNLHRSNHDIATRDGKKVTFLRSATFHRRPKPAPPRRSPRPPNDPAFIPFQQ